MNKIERALMTRFKELLFEYAADEMERIKKELQAKNTQTLLNVFNTGILLDLDRLQDHGINQVLKALENGRKMMQKKAKKV
jgi:hypothetical protein